LKPTTIAVDLAKSVFEIAVSDRPGRIRERHRLSRARFVRFFAQPALVLLEACGSAHHWARELTALGHRVLLPPHLTVPYVARDKTDRSDAKALLEAFRNEDIHPVPIKTLGQQVRFRGNSVNMKVHRNCEVDRNDLSINSPRSISPMA
jgi:transposase